MSMFQDWLKKKGYYEGFGDDSNPTNKFNFNIDDDDFAEDHDRLENELFKTILRKYPEETMDFFQTVAQRGDAEILNLIKKLDRGRGPRLSREPRHPSNYDEISPSSADAGFSGGSEGEI